MQKRPNAAAQFKMLGAQIAQFGVTAEGGGEAMRRLKESLVRPQVKPQRPRTWNADELGMTPDDYRELAWSMEQHELEQRLKALRALWFKPEVLRTRTNGYVDYKAGRDEEWTFWRSVKATIGIIFNLRAHGTGGVPIAYWDSGPQYGGWSVDVLELHPRCHVEIYYDGETCL